MGSIGVYQGSPSWENNTWKGPEGNEQESQGVSMKRIF